MGPTCSQDNSLTVSFLAVSVEHVGDMMELCNEHRGIQLDYHYDEASGRSTLRYELPLSEIATEFFSKLKSR